jgi:hypothetical protein
MYRPVIGTATAAFYIEVVALATEVIDRYSPAIDPDYVSLDAVMIWKRI